MAKKRVEIYDKNDGEVYEQLLLTEDQVRLIEYLDNRECLNEYVNVRVFDEDNVVYHEV